MLDLRRSRTRAAVVRELFGFPDAEIHARGLARVTGEAVANVHRELIRLEREGWVVARRSGNRKLYRVDTGNPLYPAASRLVDETVGPAGLLREALAGLRGVGLALLVARAPGPGARRLQVLVVGSCRADQLAEALAPASEALRGTIEPLLLDHGELLRRLRQHDPRLVHALEAPHTVLAGDEHAVRALLSAGGR